MRIGNYWLIAMVVGLAAIFILRATSGLPAEQRHSIVVALVALGTCVLAIARFRSRSPRPVARTPTESDAPTAPANIEKRRLYAAWGSIVLILMAWVVALVLGNSYVDTDSRLTILDGLSLFTAVVVTVALLLAPAATTARGSLAVFVVIVIAWFAGSILLPTISSWAWGSSYGFERVVNAVPGRSFVPLAALFIRSIGHRFGLKMWVGRQR